VGGECEACGLERFDVGENSEGGSRDDSNNPVPQTRQETRNAGKSKQDFDRGEERDGVCAVQNKACGRGVLRLRFWADKPLVTFVPPI
jgi:hypothetical protein